MKDDKKPEDLLESFVRFAAANRNITFWQALRLWADVDAIYLGSSADAGGHRVVDADGMALYIKDTYHFTGRQS